MSERVREIEPDPERAADSYLQQAEEHLDDARSEELGRSSRFLLAYQAMVVTMSGALLAAGRRVRSGPGGHVAMIKAAAALFDDDRRQLFARIDDSRSYRNQIAYEADEIEVNELAEILAEAEELLDLVGEFVADRRT